MGRSRRSLRTTVFLFGAALALASCASGGTGLRRSWLAADTGRGETLITFRGRPTGGEYHRLVRAGVVFEREWGHWIADDETLRLLILATDVRNHPGFGVSTPYRYRIDPDGSLVLLLESGQSLRFEPSVRDAKEEIESIRPATRARDAAAP